MNENESTKNRDDGYLFETDIKFFADAYGWHEQSLVLIEEMGELTQAIMKYHRAALEAGDRGTMKYYFAILEEAADVMIMLEQIIYLMNGGDKVKEWMKIKLERQYQRYKDAAAARKEKEA